MTKEGLTRVRGLLAQIDDTIYYEARQRGLADREQDFKYTDEETSLSTIIDEAQGEVTKMLEALV